MSLDPSHFSVPHTPTWEQEPDFGAVMSDQIKRAPWLAISLLAHVVAGLLLYVILDGARPLRAVVATYVAVPEDEEPVPEEKEPIEKIEYVDTADVPVEDVVVTEEDQSETDNVIDDATHDAPQSAFANDQWNVAIGTDGGAAGPWGGRGKGSGKVGRKTEDSIRGGLEWLKNHQDDSGKWDCDAFMKHDRAGAPCDGAGNPVHDIGVTGLALLAFLGDGNTMRAGQYKEQVRKAVRWLRSQQGDNGLFGTPASQHFIYDHAIASYAMCEAFGLSKYRTLRDVAQGGINYLESHRNAYGCWRYHPKDNENDISVTGWCIMAYKSAKDFDLLVNTQALRVCAHYLDELTDPASGRCGYAKRGEPSSRHRGDHSTRFPPDKGEALTAVGLFCRFFLGQDPKKTPVMPAAAQTILAKPPVWREDGSIDHYYWYYGSYALFQMGEPHWGKWRRHLMPAVVEMQRKDGNFDGSWDAKGVWGDDGGRVYSTAMLVLTLEAYYRYSKLVR